MINLIKEFPVPLVYKIIGRGKCTGELEIRSKNFTRRFGFSQGRLECAHSEVPQERLVDILLLMGVLDRDQAVRIKAMSGQKPVDRIGRIMVQQGFLSEKRLYDCLVAQAIQIAANTFGLTDGQWRFNLNNATPTGPNYRIQFPRIIIQGARQIHDFSIYKNLFGGCLIKTVPPPERIKKLLSPSEITFVNRIAAQPGKTVADHLRGIRFEAEIFWRELVKLFLLDVLEFSDTARWASDTQTMIQTQFSLELTKPSVSLPPDLGRLRSLIETTKRSQPTPSESIPSETIQLAPEKTAVEKPEKSSHAISGIDFLPKSGETGTQRKASVIFPMAQKLYNEGKYREAVLALGRIVRPDRSPAAHILLLGLCQSRIAEFHHDAEQNLRLAAEKEPENPDPLFALGDLYRWQKNTRKSLETYRKALKMFQSQIRTDKQGIDEDEIPLSKKLLMTFRKKIE